MQLHSVHSVFEAEYLEHSCYGTQLSEPSMPSIIVVGGSICEPECCGISVSFCIEQNLPNEFCINPLASVRGVQGSVYQLTNWKNLISDSEFHRNECQVPNYFVSAFNHPSYRFPPS